MDIPDDALSFETPDEAFQYLRLSGLSADEDIDIGEAALALALVFLAGLSPARYRHHLQKIARMTAESFATHEQHKDEDSLHLRLEILREVLHKQLGYHGDTRTFDDIENINLIRVIERRQGLPVSLGILYIVAARAQGWLIEGLNFPGHFLLRLEKDGERVIVDPFNDGREMAAADLRLLLKSVAGEKAELSHTYYEKASNRDILVRLQNNLKKRLIEKEEYNEAILVAETIEALDPAEYRILFDKGVLFARVGESKRAIETLEAYVSRTPYLRDKDEAKALIRQIELLKL